MKEISFEQLNEITGGTVDYPCQRALKDLKSDQNHPILQLNAICYCSNIGDQNYYDTYRSVFG